MSSLILRIKDVNDTIHNLSYKIIPDLVRDIIKSNEQKTKKDYFDIYTFGKILKNGRDSFNSFAKSIDNVVAQESVVSEKVISPSEESVGGTRHRRRRTRRRQTRRRR